MFILLLILLVKALGDCVNPTDQECAVYSTKDICNDGTGCRFRDAFDGACGPQTADSCAKIVDKESCTGGCSWFDEPSCVRKTQPVCGAAVKGICSEGCVRGSERVRCMSREQVEVEQCGQMPEDSCASDEICKVDGSNCVPKTAAERCHDRGLGNNGSNCVYRMFCLGFSCYDGKCVCVESAWRASTCKVENGSCVPRSEEETRVAWCSMYDYYNCSKEPLICKAEEKKCVPKTLFESYNLFCGQTGTVSNCVSLSQGICQLVGDKCQADPNFDFDSLNDYTCSLNYDESGCDVEEGDESLNCGEVRDHLCVLHSCDVDEENGGACSKESQAAGCVWVTNGYCGVNSSLTACENITECSSDLVKLGCVSTPAVPDACLPKAELTCPSSGSNTCSLPRLDAGCKTVVVEPPSASSTNLVPVSMVIFMLLILFW